MSQEVAARDERPPREIGISSLGHARDYARNVADVTDRVVERLRGARIEEANELLAQVLDAIHVLVFTIDHASRLLDPDEAARCPQARLDSEAWVARLSQAQENQDWIRLADVLEYEVGESLRGWAESIVAMIEVPAS